MAITNYYVDPSLGSDTGDGTVGTPWGRASGSVVQYALDNITQGTDGDQINVKAGTADTLAGALDLSTYGTPDGDQPLIFRGYTSTANDGGIGEIDGNGNKVYDEIGITQVNFIELEIHNGDDTTYLLRMGLDCSVQLCELRDNTAGGVYGHGSFIKVLGCHIHNIGGAGIYLNSTYGTAANNYLQNGTNDFSAAIHFNNAGVAIHHNIISLDGSSNGIEDVSSDDSAEIFNNSILASSGSGVGIDIDAGSMESMLLYNNLVEGFTSGTGIKADGATEYAHRISHNAVYNCNTAYDLGAGAILTDDNETLGATPFAKSGSDTFANRLTYFAPEDTGNVIDGGF